MPKPPDDQPSPPGAGAESLAEAGEEAVDEAGQQGAGAEVPAGAGTFTRTLLSS